MQLIPERVDRNINFIAVGRELCYSLRLIGPSLSSTGLPLEASWKNGQPILSDPIHSAVLVARESRTVFSRIPAIAETRLVDGISVVSRGPRRVGPLQTQCLQAFGAQALSL